MHSKRKHQVKFSSEIKRRFPRPTGRDAAAVYDAVVASEIASEEFLHLTDGGFDTDLALFHLQMNRNGHEVKRLFPELKAAWEKYTKLKADMQKVVSDLEEFASHSRIIKRAQAYREWETLGKPKPFFEEMKLNSSLPVGSPERFEAEVLHLAEIVRAGAAALPFPNVPVAARKNDQLAEFVLDVERETGSPQYGRLTTLLNAVRVFGDRVLEEGTLIKIRTRYEKEMKEENEAEGPD